MTGILALLTGRIAAISYAVIILLLSLTLTWVYVSKSAEISTVKSANADLTKSIDDPVSGYRVQVSHLTISNNTLTTAVNLQNTAMDNLNTMIKAQSKAAADALAAAQATRGAVDAMIKNIYKPSTDPDKCRATETLNRTFLLTGAPK